MKFRALETFYEEGVNYNPGDELELTAERAKSLGSSVQVVRNQEAPELPTTSIADVASDRAMKPSRVRTR